MAVNMKRLILLAAAMMTLTASAQFKIVESSDKKAPDWIGDAEKGYLIVSAEGATLDEVKNKCLEQVKLQMLESVANNIEYSTETLVSQITSGEDVQSNIDFKMQGRTSVANLPYISGVSMAKATASYWAKYYDKKTRETRYAYHLKYRFGPAQQQELKDQFQELDDKMAEVLEKYDGKEDENVASVDDIDRIVAELEVAKTYFFDRTRQTRAQQIQNLYKGLYQKIVIEHKMGEGCFIVYLRLGKTLLNVKGAPKLTASCASQLDAKLQKNGAYLVTYSTEDCIEDDHNTIEVVFSIKGRKMKKSIEI